MKNQTMKALPDEELEAARRMTKWRLDQHVQRVENERTMVVIASVHNVPSISEEAAEIASVHNLPSISEEAAELKEKKEDTPQGVALGRKDNTPVETAGSKGESCCCCMLVTVIIVRNTPPTPRFKACSI